MKVPVKSTKLIFPKKGYIQGASQKILLTTKKSTVVNSSFSGPPCMY